MLSCSRLRFPFPSYVRSSCGPRGPGGRSQRASRSYAHCRDFRTRAMSGARVVRVGQAGWHAEVLAAVPGLGGPREPSPICSAASALRPTQTRVPSPDPKSIIGTGSTSPCRPRLRASSRRSRSLAPSRLTLGPHPWSESTPARGPSGALRGTRRLESP